MPGAVADLAALGVDPAGHPLAGIRYLDGGRASPRRRSATAPGRGVRRTTLHAALRDAVADAGVARRATRSARSTTGATTSSSTASRPGYLVAADGLHSPVRRLLGLDRPARGPAPLRAALPRRAGAVDVFVEVHWAAGRRGLRDPGRRRPGRRRGAHRAAGAASTSCSPSFPLLARAAGPARRCRRCRGAGPLRQRARPPGRRPGAARRRRGRLRRRADRRGHRARPRPGPGRRRRDRRPASPSATRRRLAPAQPAPRAAHPRPARAPPGSPPVRRRIVPAAARLPRVFAAAVNQLARPA